MKLSDVQLDVLKRVRDGRPLLDRQSRAIQNHSTHTQRHAAMSAQSDENKQAPAPESFETVVADNVVVEVVYKSDFDALLINHTALLKRSSEVGEEFAALTRAHESVKIELAGADQACADLRKAQSQLQTMNERLSSDLQAVKVERDALRAGRDAAVRLWTECGKSELELTRNLSAAEAQRDEAVRLLSDLLRQHEERDFGHIETRRVVANCRSFLSKQLPGIGEGTGQTICTTCGRRHRKITSWDRIGGAITSYEMTCAHCAKQEGK